MSGGLDALAPLPPAPGQDPAAIARAITAGAGTSFSHGMRILAKPRREAMWALYAFARVVDDIADGPEDGPDWPLAEKRRLLAAWRSEIAETYAGRPVSAIGLALADPIARHALPEEEFVLLIEGMEMDAEGPIVAPPMVELERYIRRVAGAVGMLSMRIFGAWRGAVSERFALALARALQLTNILRDIDEDATRGRLYLPAEILAAHGLPRDPRGVTAHPARPSAAAEIGRMARASFSEARGLVGAHARGRIAPALLMMGVYAAYLARMEATGFGPGGPIRLSKGEKLWRGLECLVAPGGAARSRIGPVHG